MADVNHPLQSQLIFDCWLVWPISWRISSLVWRLRPANISDWLIGEYFPIDEEFSQYRPIDEYCPIDKYCPIDRSLQYYPIAKYCPIDE